MYFNMLILFISKTNILSRCFKLKQKSLPPSMKLSILIVKLG